MNPEGSVPLDPGLGSVWCGEGRPSPVGAAAARRVLLGPHPPPQGLDHVLAHSPLAQQLVAPAHLGGRGWDCAPGGEEGGEMAAPPQPGPSCALMAPL